MVAGRCWLRCWLLLAPLCASAAAAAAGAGDAAGRLYTERDPLLILSSRNVKAAVSNSSSALLLQFYSSWCGHCVHYSATWKELARDVREWQQVMRLAVLDCAQEENFDVCKEYSIKFYPTFKYFRAHSPATDKGTIYRGADREIQTVRHLMVNVLQNHTAADWPQHCPPLHPYSSAELLPLLGQTSLHYTAIIAEEADSYIGREVILDLQQFSGVVVKRVLSSELPLLEALHITDFPSVSLLHPNGPHTLLHVEKKLRFFFSSALRSLPGVRRSSAPTAGRAETGEEPERPPTEPWRDFERSKVYRADLESALHYLLRVEVATRQTLEGEELKIFKDFVTLLAKLFPGGGGSGALKLMETLSDWLSTLPLQQIPYQAVLDLVDNKMRMEGVFLGAELRWVGCQGSRAGLRGYPCSLWTLFHVLTVQHEATPTALDNTALEGRAAPVLQVMRGYIRTFFGCEQCGRHFEEAAAASVEAVSDGRQQTLWLWRQHNMVNARLAGSQGDDPAFPKAPWPGPALCPSCHEEKNGVHVWNEDNVHGFLRRHYGSANLSPKYALTPPQQQQQQQQQPPEAAGRPDGTPRHPPPPPPPPRQEAGGGGAAWILGLGFNSVDMSLCVLLYVCSSIFLMLLFFFFKVRSRRWKLRHSRLHV